MLAVSKLLCMTDLCTGYAHSHSNTTIRLLLDYDNLQSLTEARRHRMTFKILGNRCNAIQKLECA
jgi:hypothetical protein